MPKRRPQSQHAQKLQPESAGGTLRKQPPILNQSLLSSQHQQQYGYKIDLHGMNERVAISSLSRFFEQCRKTYDQKQRQLLHDKTPRRHKTNNNNRWALVITGSGAHSMSGPVLRTAVQSILNRRQMTYSMNKGRGSFTVDIASGFDLYSSDVDCVDSKVVVVGQDDPCTLPLRKQKLPTATQSTVTSAPTPNPLSSSFNPLPTEIAKHEAHVRQIKQLSSNEYNTNRAMKQKDVKLYNLALEESVALADEVQSLSQKEEDELNQILQLSTLEEQKKSKEEKELERILELSKLDCTKEEDEEDEEVKQALLLSLQQQEEQEETQKEKEEEEMLKKAMEQ
eukprot:13089601-Ditylum_brightwellii.AAC.1